MGAEFLGQEVKRFAGSVNGYSIVSSARINHAAKRKEAGYIRDADEKANASSCALGVFDLIQITRILIIDR
jgi:hypothetical protein